MRSSALVESPAQLLNVVEWAFQAGEPLDDLKVTVLAPTNEVSRRQLRAMSTLAAVALGAVFVERHITLDRAMWGSDQSASVEPPGLQRLVRDVRIITESLGDGVKKIYDGELAAMKKLRRVQSEAEPQLASTGS